METIDSIKISSTRPAPNDQVDAAGDKHATDKLSMTSPLTPLASNDLLYPFRKFSSPLSKECIQAFFSISRFGALGNKPALYLHLCFQAVTEG